MNDAQLNQPSDALPAAPSPVAAYLLWFFLGGFGAHRFYFGRAGSGGAMLGLLVGSILLTPFLIGLLGFPILTIWWLIDAFLILGWLKERQSFGAVQPTPQAAPPGFGPLPSQPAATGTIDDAAPDEAEKPLYKPFSDAA
jgi:TM2 domain-containing membrane protein YozV